MSMEKFQPLIVSVPTPRIAKVHPLQLRDHRPFDASQRGFAPEPLPLIKPPEIGVHAAAGENHPTSMAVTGVGTMSSAQILPPLFSFTSPPQTPQWSPSPVQENTLTTTNVRKSSFLSVPNVFQNDFQAHLTIGSHQKESYTFPLHVKEEESRNSPDDNNSELPKEMSPITGARSPESLSDSTGRCQVGETSLPFETERSLSLGSLTVLCDNSPQERTGKEIRGHISPSRASPTPRRNRPVLACGKPARHNGRCTFSPIRDDFENAFPSRQPSSPNNRTTPTERRLRSFHGFPSSGDQIQLYNFKLTPSKKTKKAREETAACCLNRRAVNATTAETTPTVIQNPKVCLNRLSKVSRKKETCRGEQEDGNPSPKSLVGQRDHSAGETLGIGCSLPPISDTKNPLLDWRR